MDRTVLAPKLSKLSFDALENLANLVYTNMLTNPLYTTPNPTMPSLNTDITAFVTAKTAWGTAGNRGSHADYINLVAARIVLESSLTQLVNYCETTTPYDTVALASTGFPLKKSKAAVGKLDQVRNLRQSTASNISLGELKLMWNKPLGTENIKINGYRVLRSATPSLGDAEQIGITIRCSFTDTNPGVGNQYYWVIPFNGVEGVQSDVCIASAKPIP